MRNVLPIPVLCLAVMLSSPAVAADIDWSKVDTALGKTASVQGEVHRYGIPRSDLTVTLDGVQVKKPWRLADGLPSSQHRMAAWPWEI